MILSTSPLLIPSKLAAKIGLNEAIVLQQLHYWIERSQHVIDGIKWVYNRLSDWLEQFPFLSRYQLRKAFSNLKELGLIVTEQHEKKRWKRRLWYAIDYDKLNDLLGTETLAAIESSKSEPSTVQSLDSRSVENQPIESATVEPSCRTETTPENTSKISLSSAGEREVKKSAGNEKGQEESTFTPLASLLPKTNPPKAEAKHAPSDSSSGPARDPVENSGFFNWVVEQAKKLPNPPRSPRAAAKAWISRNRDELEEEYEEWKALEKRKEGMAGTAYDTYKAPAEPASLSQLEDEEERRAYKLSALKGMWKIESLRPRVAQECKKWDFLIGPEGPRELEF